MGSVDGWNAICWRISARQRYQGCTAFAKGPSYTARCHPTHGRDASNVVVSPSGKWSQGHPVPNKNMKHYNMKRSVKIYDIYIYILYTLCISPVRFFFLNDSNLVSFAAFRRETLWTAHAIDLQIPGSVMVRNWVPLTWLSNENLPLGIHSKWHEKVCRKRFVDFLSHLMIILYPQESSKN